MPNPKITNLVKQLISLPMETEWLEFKVDNGDPETIGKNISAISNAAALMQKPFGYIIWGIENENHQIVGTTFEPFKRKIGNEELQNWLSRSLEPNIDFKISENELDGSRVVVFEIPSATIYPVRFKNEEYIRFGSYTKKLKDFPEKEKSLWKLFSNLVFEKGIIKNDVSSDEVLSLIDYPAYFQLTNQTLPDNRAAIIEKLISECIVCHKFEDFYDITNLGALLFAKRLDSFERLGRKALRVIFYRGNNRAKTIKEHILTKGYAVGFEELIQYINDQLPQNEEIKNTIRIMVRMYPEIAIRELVANALIHQDFSVTGTGPTVEVFDGRMEITNPGQPLIDTLRFMDIPPRSRNEILASLMRRMGICEERGSGIDKVIFAVETFQLPAPDFRVAGDNTVAILYSPRESEQMDKAERVRACYQHACLLYISGQRMSNLTLRKRLRIKDSNYPQASRIISDAIKANLIKPQDVLTKRDNTYLPFWA